MRTKIVFCVGALAATTFAGTPASADDVGVGSCYASLNTNGNRICRMVATSDVARWNYTKNTTCGSSTVIWTVISNTQVTGGSRDINTIPGNVYELQMVQCGSGSSYASLYSV